MHHDEKLQHLAASAAEAIPDNKSSLLPPPDARRKRYSKLKEESDASYMDRHRQQGPGITRDGVPWLLAGQYTAFRQQVASVPEAVSPNNCAQMPGRFTHGTFDPAQRIPEAYQRVSSHLSP